MPTTEPSSPEFAAPPFEPIAWGPITSVLAAIAVLHLCALSGYGYFRDELYYLASRAHLAFGFVDQPPFSILALKVWTAIGGDSVVSIRLFALLAGLVAALLCGLLARELGGGRFAQGLATLCLGFAPMLMGMTHTFSMNVLDLDAWLLAAWLLARIVRSGEARWWPWLGLVLGLGLENKISVLWLGAGIAVGLVLGPQRRQILTRGPWIAGGIAVALFVPYVWWNWAHGFPTLEFIHNAETRKMVATTPLALLSAILLELNPAIAPIWVGGLLWTLLSRSGRRFRSLGLVWLTALAIVASSGTAKAYYLAPATSLLFAPGAVAFESWLARGRLRILRLALAGAVLAIGLLAAPLALPLLREPRYVAYAAALGVHPKAAERSALAEMPQHFADQHGWRELADRVAAACARLTPAERPQAVVFGQNYGEAGAIDLYGPQLGLPPVISGHNSYWMWGPGNASGEVVVIIGGDAEDNARFFDTIEIVDHTVCEYCMPYERNRAISIGRGLKRSFPEIWPQLKNFI